MVNTTDFIERLEILLNHYGMTASSFADKVGVQRSSISHLLSGRNKPSLEFVLKVVKTFPEVNLYWLLNGKGTFPVVEKGQSYPTPLSTSKEFKELSESLADGHLGPKAASIEKIIIFYSDGSFRAYSENKG